LTAKRKRKEKKENNTLAGYTPMQPIYPAEVVSNRMRAKAMGTYKITAGAAGFLNTFVGPIALSSVSFSLTFQ
jgi:hypothetical protein